MILLFLVTLAAALAWIVTPLAILSYKDIIQINPAANLQIVTLYLFILPFITYAFLDVFNREYLKAKNKELKYV